MKERTFIVVDGHGNFFQSEGGKSREYPDAAVFDSATEAEPLAREVKGMVISDYGFQREQIELDFTIENN